MNKIRQITRAWDRMYKGQDMNDNVKQAVELLESAECGREWPKKGLPARVILDEEKYKQAIALLRPCGTCGGDKQVKIGWKDDEIDISCPDCTPKPEEKLKCKCGWTGTVDEQDALGTECGCCPDCGNEDLKPDHIPDGGKKVPNEHLTKIEKLANSLPDKMNAEQTKKFFIDLIEILFETISSLDAAEQRAADAETKCGLLKKMNALWLKNRASTELELNREIAELQAKLAEAEKSLRVSSDAGRQLGRMVRERDEHVNQLQTALQEKQAEIERLYTLIKHHYDAESIKKDCYMCFEIERIATQIKTNKL